MRIGDCIVEVDGVDVYRKPISTFSNLMLGPPGTVVTIGLKRADTTAIYRVMLRRTIVDSSAAPVAVKDAKVTSESAVLHDGNIRLRRRLETAKDDHER